MNHLIVFAHPNKNSFGKAMLDAAAKATEEKGSNVRIRDLYQLGFNAVLSQNDFETIQNGQVPKDIADEQEHIRWADVITFVYPVWWISFPAILKGYVDRVFSLGFAYEYRDNVAYGLLKEKKALLFCSTGAPDDVYAVNGMHEAMKHTTDDGIFNFAGITDVKHSFFGDVPNVDDEIRKGYLKEVENTVKEAL